jgi:hypothetical protein
MPQLFEDSEKGFTATQAFYSDLMSERYYQYLLQTQQVNMAKKTDMLRLISDGGDNDIIMRRFNAFLKAVPAKVEGLLFGAMCVKRMICIRCSRCQSIKVQRVEEQDGIFYLHVQSAENYQTQV